MGEVMNLKDKSDYMETESYKASSIPVLSRGFIVTYNKAPYWARTSICKQLCHVESGATAVPVMFYLMLMLATDCHLTATSDILHHITPCHVMSCHGILFRSKPM